MFGKIRRGQSRRLERNRARGETNGGTGKMTEMEMVRKRGNQEVTLECENV